MIDDGHRHLAEKLTEAQRRLSETTTSLVNADRHVKAAADLLDNLTASRVFDAQLVSDLAAVRRELTLAMGATDEGSAPGT